MHYPAYDKFKWSLMEGDYSLGGGPTMQYTDGVLQNCPLETCIMLLTNVTQINLIENKIKGLTMNKTNLYWAMK